MFVEFVFVFRGLGKKSLQMEWLEQHLCTVLCCCRSRVRHRSHWVTVLAGVCSFWTLQGRISFLAFSGVEGLPAFLGL